jgi:uncharacterized protein YgbK (DUF1537 family)
MLLGCIADDFTGATDLASTLVRGGMRVVQTVGVPRRPFDGDADAVVVALKSRTIEPEHAVAQSLQALRWLQQGGARQFFFKVCSTFDSTDRGNIGPVAEALMQALGCGFTVACPALPENGRTVFNGHLFVGEALLSESSMRHHPLTPMADANLARVLQRQARGRVGLIGHRAVRRGVDAIRERMAELRREGVAMAIVDAAADDELLTLGRAFAELPLLVGGSGLAIGLPAAFGLAPGDQATLLPPAAGACAIVSGSCSAASNAQTAHYLGQGGQGFAVDPLRIASGDDVVAEALAWAGPRIGRQQPLLVYATAEPGAVQAVQQALGVERAGLLVEQALSAIARALVERGVRQLVVAGGETSGACVQALGIERLRIGRPIDPGVPWCLAQSAAAPAGGLHIALKSGNFGGTDFFTKAFALPAAVG